MYLVKVVDTKKEHDDAFAVRTKVFVEEQGIPLQLEYDEYDAMATHFIMYEEEKIIGAARLRIIEDNFAKIERVSILQSQRGKKLSALIMKEIEKSSITIQIKKSMLHAQSYAMKSSAIW